MKGAEFEKPWCMSRFYLRFQLSRSFFNAVCSEVYGLFIFYCAPRIDSPSRSPAGCSTFSFLNFFPPLLSFTLCLLPASLRLQTGRLLHTPIISIRGEGAGLRAESLRHSGWVAGVAGLPGGDSQGLGAGPSETAAPTLGVGLGARANRRQAESGCGSRIPSRFWALGWLWMLRGGRGWQPRCVLLWALGF